MDAPLYENLPGFATILHSIEVPELPDQKIRFPDGEEMDITAGATACESQLGQLTGYTELTLCKSIQVRKASSYSVQKSKSSR